MRTSVCSIVVAVLLLVLAVSVALPTPSRADVSTASIEAIKARLEDLRASHGVTALLVGIGRGETLDLVAATGTSMAGVAAVPEMSFRSGAMAIGSMGTILLQLVDEGIVDLDDTIDAWLPDYPSADEISLRMLADSTSGYADFETDPAFVAALSADPFYVWSAEELLRIAFDHDQLFEPGSDFAYAHTNFVVLAQALSAAAGIPYAELIQSRIVDRFGLSGTEVWTTAELREPPLHAFSTERGVLEDSTYWSPSWTSYTGILNSTLSDVMRLMRALATGASLSPQSFATMTAATNVGMTGNTEEHYFSLGMEFVAPWVQKTFAFGGYGGQAGYAPASDLTLVVVATHSADTDPDNNPATAIFKEISATLLE